MNLRAAAALLAAALLVGGCRDGGEDPDGDGAAQEIPGDEVKFLRTFPASTHGGFAAPDRAVIRDAAAWMKAWETANAGSVPMPREPKVDFAKEMVALVSLGRKTTGGWSVEIVAARKDRGKLVIHVAEREPPAGSVATQAISCPWHAVVLPAESLPVEWAKYEAPGGK